MEKVARAQLLPGVSGPASEREILFQSAAVVRRARLRAAVRDGADLMLLLLVDLLFARWPLAHVPLLGRHTTISVLLALNALVIAYVWLARSIPQWRARRMSGTWCPAEQRRVRI